MEIHNKSKKNPKKENLVALDSSWIDLLKGYDVEVWNVCFALGVLYAWLIRINDKSGLNGLQMAWNLDSSFLVAL